MNMIDKDAVLNMIDMNIEPHTHGAWDSGYNVALSEMREKIKQMPVVETEPVTHGRWILCDDGYVRCSECNRKAFIENDETILTDFCHGCGADMIMDGDSE